MTKKVNSFQATGDSQQSSVSRQQAVVRRHQATEWARFRKFLKFPKSILFEATRLGKLLKFPQPMPIILSILTLIFQNCQAPTEGCLDVRATNFDVTASKTCVKACTCTYPALVVSANYKMGTSDFYLDSTYTNDMSQKFRIVSTQMYLSDFQLVNAKNETIRTIDSVALTRATDTIKVLNNYALVGKSVGFDFTIGTFNGTGTFTKFKFRLGLDDVAAKTVPSKMPTTHPLSTKADSMYITSQKQYIFNKFIIAFGTNFKDTLRLNILTPTDKEVVLNKSFSEGANVKIPLTINYLNFFSGVKFSTDTSVISVIQNKIIQNTATVFSIR